MPRNELRNRLKRKQSEFDVEPTANINKKKTKKPSSPEDESGERAPRQFQLMMKVMERRTNGQKISSEDTGEQPKYTKSGSSSSNLQIQPGEKLSEFSRRVNEALPLVKAKSGMPSKADMKRMKRRERLKAEEEQRRQKRIERREEYENREDDLQQEKQKRKSKREVSPDPWSHLEKKKAKFGEVVDAPPVLKLPTKLLTNVPNASGSLAKREMLAQERERVIAEYRCLMEKKRFTLK